MTRPVRDDAVGRAFVALADTLVDDYDVIDMLDQLVSHSVALLATDAAGLLLSDGRDRLSVVAASSEDAELMELLQLQNEQGPCLDCFSTRTPVSVPDLADATNRWPAFAAALPLAVPFRSVHAIPMRLRGQAIGALNLFRYKPGSMSETDLALGQALADVATIGILQERAIRRGEVVAEQLQHTLNSRMIIEQAKGILAHSFTLSMDTAFDVLRRYCHSHHLRLADEAIRLVSGELAPTAVLPARKSSDFRYN